MRDNNRKSFLERLCTHFYDNEDELPNNFNVLEVERILRLRELDRHIVRNPMREDKEHVDWLISRYKIKERQAYYDLRDLKDAIGIAFSFNKESERRELTQGLRRNMAIAEEKGDFSAYARLAKIYKDIGRLDKDDPERVNPNLAPMSIAPTDDVTVLGLPALEEDEEAIKLRLRAKFDKQFAQEVEFEDVRPEPEKDPMELSFMRIDKYATIQKNN